MLNRTLNRTFVLTKSTATLMENNESSGVIVYRYTFKISELCRISEDNMIVEIDKTDKDFEEILELMGLDNTIFYLKGKGLL